MERFIRLVNVSKSFGNQLVLDNINLYIDKDEFVTLLGPSGCGKTTTLRIIGGFEKPTEGKVEFIGKDVTNEPPNKRFVNTIFQKYALFPNMDVGENVAFGLRVKKTPQKEIQKRVSEMLALVNLKDFEKRQISSLSGGQAQRVAIARALVNEPQALLLDEPLGALDLKLRREMQLQLKDMQRRLGITFLYVTHDQEEALSMSDTIVVMNEGRILQIGSPADVYNEPKNAFVARFVGESNMLEGVMKSDFCVKFCGVEFECVDRGFETNAPVDVVIRPEDASVVEADGANITGIVTHTTFRGAQYEMLIESNGFTWKAHSTKLSEAGKKVGISVAPDLIHVMAKK